MELKCYRVITLGGQSCTLIVYETKCEMSYNLEWKCVITPKLKCHIFFFSNVVILFFTYTSFRVSKFFSTTVLEAELSD